MKRWAVISAAVMAATLLLAGCGGGEGGDGDDEKADAAPAAPGARDIEVTATSFSFEPSDIEVDVGEDAAIVLTSKDIPHDFTIDELDLHVPTGARKTSEGGLHVTKAGTYTFYCTVPGHRSAGMEGTLVAT